MLSKVYYFDIFWESFRDHFERNRWPIWMAGALFCKKWIRQNSAFFHVDYTQKTHLFALFHVFNLNITNNYFIYKYWTYHWYRQSGDTKPYQFPPKMCLFSDFMSFRFLEKMSQKAWHFLLIFGKCGEFFQVFYLYNRVLTPWLARYLANLSLFSSTS